MFFFTSDGKVLSESEMVVIQKVSKPRQSDAEKVALAIIKDAKRDKSKDWLHGASVDKNGHTWVSNGFLMMEFENQIELPTTPACGSTWLKYWEVKSMAMKNDSVTEELPAYAELKGKLSKTRAEAKANHNWSCTLVYVTEAGTAFNVQFLMWAIKATGTQTIHISGKRTPSYLEGNGVWFCVLPINTTHDHGYYSF